MTPSQPQMPVPQLPNAPPPPPVISNTPTGSKPGKKSMTPSFLNAQALPSQGADVGSKKLIGQ